MLKVQAIFCGMEEVIPTEILFRCFEFLEASDLLIASLVCKRWKELSSTFPFIHKERSEQT
jgi:hypothetical protein